MGTIQYNIKFDTGNSIKSLGDLEKELSKINEEIKDVDVNSKAFKDLSTRAQTLTHDIEGINKAVTGITLEDKIQTMDGALKTLAGSTQAVVGGLGLMGIESDKFKKFEESAASAIAFGMGIKDLSEGIGQLARSQAVSTAATKVATIAQKAFNAVMSMNPLGILITGLTLAGGLIYAFRDKILNVIKTALGPFQGIIDTISNSFTKLGEKLGIVEDARTKQIKANIKALENQVQLDEAAGKSSLQTQKRVLAEKRKLLEKGTEEYAASLQEEKVLNTKLNKEKADASKAINDKLAADTKAKNEKQKAEDEKRLAEIAQNQEAYKTLLQKYKDEELDVLANTDQKKLDLEKTRALKEVDNLKVSEEEKNKVRLQIAETFRLKQDELNVKIGEENKKKDDENAQKLLDKENQKKDNELELLATKAMTDQEIRDAAVAAEEEKYNRLIAVAKKNGEDTTTLEQLKAAKIAKIDSDLTKKKIDNAKAEQMIKEQAVNDTINATQDALATLFGESKAIASANVLIDAAQAGVGIMKSSQSIPAPFSIPFQVAQFGLLAATTFKSLQAINSAQPGDGGGSAPAIPTGGASIPATPTAETPLMQNITAQQAAQNGAEPIKAYVLAGDVKDGVEAESKIRMRRTVGA